MQLSNWAVLYGRSEVHFVLVRDHTIVVLVLTRLMGVRLLRHITKHVFMLMDVCFNMLSFTLQAMIVSRYAHSSKFFLLYVALTIHIEDVSYYYRCFCLYC